MISQQIRMQLKEFADTEQQRGLKIQKSLLKYIPEMQCCLNSKNVAWIPKMLPVQFTPAYAYNPRNAVPRRVLKDRIP